MNVIAYDGAGRGKEITALIDVRTKGFSSVVAIDENQIKPVTGVQCWFEGFIEWTFEDCNVVDVEFTPSSLSSGSDRWISFECAYLLTMCRDVRGRDSKGCAHFENRGGLEVLRECCQGPGVLRAL